MTALTFRNGSRIIFGTAEGTDPLSSTEYHYIFIEGDPVNEHKCNAAFGAAYRALRPSADVYKVNDRVRKSRPDFEVCDYGQTWYIEAKMIDNQLTPGQQQELLRLRQASRGRVLTLWYERDGRCLLSFDSTLGAAATPVANVREAAAWVARLIESRATA